MKKCSIENCFGIVKAKGWCGKHYQQFYKNTSTYRPITGESLRDHPFYMIWFERKQAKLLCWEWTNFKTFIDDISPKPEGNYFLLRLDGTKLFGPDNFIWQEHLKRKDNETNKEWWARKRAARILANPSMDRERNCKRYFGLTIKQYEEKLKNQNYKCAICNEPETAVDGKTGSIKRLSVDHCHKRQGIRELLCWRCNGTLGKVNDDVELLQNMIDYLNKHNGY